MEHGLSVETRINGMSRNWKAFKTLSLIGFSWLQKFFFNFYFLILLVIIYFIFTVFLHNHYMKLAKKNNFKISFYSSKIFFIDLHPLFASSILSFCSLLGLHQLMISIYCISNL